MDASHAGRRGSKRARVSAEVAFDAAGPSARAGASTSDRPTPAELQEALDVIQQMKKMEPPLISRRGQPPKPNIVACALALQRGERFSDDRDWLDDAVDRLTSVPSESVRSVRSASIASGWSAWRAPTSRRRGVRMGATARLPRTRRATRPFALTVRCGMSM